MINYIFLAKLVRIRNNPLSLFDYECKEDSTISQTSDNIILPILKTSLSNAPEQAFIDGGGGRDTMNPDIHGISIILEKLLWIEMR